MNHKKAIEDFRANTKRTKERVCVCVCVWERERERERERFMRNKKLIFPLYEKFTCYTDIYSQSKNPEILDHL